MKNTKELPEHYWFENEYGNRVDVLATVGEWCMVQDETKKKPHILPLEMVLATMPEPETNP